MYYSTFIFIYIIHTLQLHGQEYRGRDLRDPATTTNFILFYNANQNKGTRIGGLRKKRKRKRIYLAAPSVSIGVAESGEEDLDTDLAGLRRSHLNVLDS